MAQIKRKEIEEGGDPSFPIGAHERRYDSGGPIAEMQADLARRLILRGAADERIAPISPGERLVRFCSAAGGYSALLAGYAVAGLAIVHWM